MYEKMMLFLRKNIVVIIFILCYFAFFSFKLTSHPVPFYDWDESIYIEVGKEMVVHKSLIPTWQNMPWLEKPPLAPAAYAILLLLPFPAEITTRTLSLLLSVTVLLLIYIWIKRATNNPTVALLTVILTAFNPIFLQRVHTVNTDVFLLLGWLGYILFAQNSYSGFLFLTIGVMSKSVLGFYPAILLVAKETYDWFRKNQTLKESLQHIKKIAIHSAILLLWFVAMILLYKNTFIQIHFEDHLLRRVTSSIESHFGKRTFYIDLLFEQFGMGILLAIPGFLTLVYLFMKKKMTEQQVFYALFLLPWFVFLNLTKTKIFWYAYPYIPQFAFLIVAPLLLVKNKKILYLISVGLIAGFFIWYVIPQNLLNLQYSKDEYYHHLAQAVKERCDSVEVLVDPEGRNTYETLKGMNLVISTTTWWGNHPSMVYYSNKKVDFFFNKKEIAKKLSTYKQKTCVAFDKKDSDLTVEKAGYTQIGSFDPMVLFIKK